MPLTPEQLRTFDRLIARRRDLLAGKLGPERARPRDPPARRSADEPAPEVDDPPLEDAIADLEDAEAARDLQELRELDAALARIADGTYDRCIDCGRDVGVERLGALPTTLRCVDCQRRDEARPAQPDLPEG
ncbi:MAG: TraR/DksA C4-type zinc finger protein [Burkholderiales bacterium]|nr:TraR/DksA C4-type zinc finger protein [Burkholderiales bacterium]